MGTEDLIETFKHMTLGDLTEFRREFENIFGVTAEMPGPRIYDPGDLPEQPMSDEPIAFVVRLTGIGPNKVPVIKAVRVLTGLGLRETKDRVEAAPSDVLVNVSREVAEKAIAALAAEGATADILPIYDDAADSIGPQ